MGATLKDNGGSTVAMRTRSKSRVASSSSTTVATNANGAVAVKTTTTSSSVTHTSVHMTKLHTFERLHQEGFAYLADNSYIRSGYRLNYSVRDCFLSLFELHNETLNVWTHIIGSFIFLSLMMYLTLSSSALGRMGGDASAATAPSWCDVKQGAFLENGHHTGRLFFATALPEYCPRTRSMLVLPEQKKYYEVASVIFEHSLHQIPSLERFHDILEENVGGISEGIAVQTELLKSELVLLKDRLTHVTDYSQVRSVKESLSHRVEGFSSFLQELATQVGADITLKYAVDELHGLADSVKNGIHIMSTVDTHHVAHWPIFVFMVSAVICLTCSAMFHLLFVHSKPAYFFLSRLDYAGITILIAGSFYPMIYYSFYCHPWLLRVYLTAISVMAALTFGVTLVPAFGTPRFLVFRTCIFLSLGFFGLVPVSHLVYHFGLFDPHVTVMIGPLLLMGLLYTLGAIIYATKFPERFYPGRFDVWFSSHQLWHICVVAAALVHFANALQQYEWRWNTMCEV
uniref:Adiponectin receptor protein n=1 Tax=Globisporangium ultimum (strain ATCC 200006 / CBS 805.95 / DAOM BR144) TaxID=431595 RepID=K3XC53_GLOUD